MEPEKKEKVLKNQLLKKWETKMQVHRACKKLNKDQNAKTAAEAKLKKSLQKEYAQEI